MSQAMASVMQAQMQQQQQQQPANNQHQGTGNGGPPPTSTSSGTPSGGANASQGQGQPMGPQSAIPGSFPNAYQMQAMMAAAAGQSGKQIASIHTLVSRFI